jgi:hypothetical protein
LRIASTKKKEAKTKLFICADVSLAAIASASAAATDWFGNQNGCSLERGKARQSFERSGLG